MKECASRIARLFESGELEGEPLEAAIHEELVKAFGAADGVPAREYKALLESSYTGLLLSVGGVVIDANDAIAAMVGRTREEMIGVSAGDVATPESAERVRQHIMAGYTGAYRIEAVRKDGSLCPLEVIGRPIEWRGQRARLTVFRDLSEQQRTYQELVDKERRYRELAEFVPAAIAEIDLEGRIRFVNGTALTMFGWSDPAAPLGIRVTELVADSDRERVAANIARRLEGDDMGGNEYLLMRSDGSVFPGLIQSAILHEGGEPVGIRAAILDLTAQHEAQQEREQLERQVLHAQKLESLGVLAGGIAHDFNNLLVAIRGNAELALLELDRKHPARSMIESVRLAALRASELTNQMLAYSGRGTFAVQAIDLGSMIREMIDLLEVSISKKATVDLALQGGLPPVDCDVAQMRQVVLNLVTNASDAIGDRTGLIRVATGEVDDPEQGGSAFVPNHPASGRFVFVSVQDDGTGMDDETLHRIFDPFFSTKREGRGLGLAAVLGIVRGHGGRIRVDTSPGAGSTFTVYLRPTENALSTAREADPLPTEGAPEGGLVLIVDDEPIVTKVARRFLERRGLEVLSAGDGVEALSVLKAHPEIDVVLLDLTMPRMSGPETFERLRAEWPHLPVIVCSGYGEMDALRRFPHDAIVGFLRKPYDPDELHALVRKALEIAARAGARA